MVTPNIFRNLTFVYQYVNKVLNVIICFVISGKCITFAVWEEKIKEKG
jgi:hypothetical protein